jgi:hypothetical protein
MAGGTSVVRRTTVAIYCLLEQVVDVFEIAIAQGPREVIHCIRLRCRAIDHAAGFGRRPACAREDGIEGSIECDVMGGVLHEGGFQGCAKVGSVAEANHCKRSNCIEGLAR